MIDWLNANAGAVVAAATVVYAAITLLLVFEARRSRQLREEATVSLAPIPRGDGLYLALRLENYGPAIAHSVRLRFWYEADGKVIEPSDVTYADPVFGPGRRRDFLPDAAAGSHLTLNALADQRHVLHAELSWTDDRLDLRRRRARHAARATWATGDLREGFYTAHPLNDKELIPVLEKHFGKVVGDLDKIAREVAEPRRRRDAAAWRREYEEEQARAAADAATAGPAPSSEPAIGKAEPPPDS